MSCSTKTNMSARIAKLKAERDKRLAERAARKQTILQRVRTLTEVA